MQRYEVLVKVMYTYRSKSDENDTLKQFPH